MAERTYLEAIREGLAEEMSRDQTVVLMGQDMRSNVYGASGGLLEEFGEARVRDLPTSETACVGAALGASMCGLRPVVDMTIASFLFVAMDQFISQVAKNRFMSGGRLNAPVVYRAAMFYRGATAAQHADRPYPMFMNVPGLRIAVPSGPAEAKGLLKSAIRSDDPVMVFEDSLLWAERAEVAGGEESLVPFGQACVCRAGTDVTVVAIASAVKYALEAAVELESDGISVEVVDPRTLVPMDWDTIVASVSRTGRLVVADPATHTCGAASEIVATVAERAFGALDAPIRRVTTPDVHAPFSPALEEGLYPDPAKIAAAVRSCVGAV